MIRYTLSPDSQNDNETSTCLDFSFAQLMKWGKTAVEGDEVWETSDTVLELFQRFLDALNVGSHHCLALHQLMEQGILTW